jgi:hypothetical protein
VVAGGSDIVGVRFGLGSAENGIRPMFSFMVANMLLKTEFYKIFVRDAAVIRFRSSKLIFMEPTVDISVTKNEIRPIIILRTGQTGFQLSG